MNEINTAIAERILGWEPIDREKGLYQKPGESGPGPVGPCPDFFFQAGNQQLREFMSNKGFTLEVTSNPVNWEKQTGKTFTARFTRGNEVFETTQPDENIAVCMAALQTVGWVLGGGGLGGPRGKSCAH